MRPFFLHSKIYGTKQHRNHNIIHKRPENYFFGRNRITAHICGIVGGIKQKAVQQADKNCIALKKRKRSRYYENQYAYQARYV